MSTIRRGRVDGEHDLCPEPHTYGPGQVELWMAWAVQMADTHEQDQCPDCGAWAIWRPKTTEPVAEPEQLGLDTEESP